MPQRWVDDVVEVYKNGAAPNKEVVGAVMRLRKEAGRSWPPHAASVIACVRTTHCAMAPRSFVGPDLFRPVRRGVWKLK
jgi:hypothetical protein